MAKSTVTWVLIADGARARLLTTGGGAKGLEPVLDQEFIGTNLASRDIASDRPGRSFDSAGEGRHAMEPPTDPKRHAKQAFAHDIAEILEAARKKNGFGCLVVVAPPQALGDLRSEFGVELRRMVIAEINKDLTQVPIHELPDYLGTAVSP